MIDRNHVCRLSTIRHGCDVNSSSAVTNSQTNIKGLSQRDILAAECLNLKRQKPSGTAFAAPLFRMLNRRSGRVPALPYPPLRCFRVDHAYPLVEAFLQQTNPTALASCRFTPGAPRMMICARRVASSREALCPREQFA